MARCYNKVMKRLHDISLIRTGYNFRSIANTAKQPVFLVSAKDLNSNFTDLDEIEIPNSYGNFLQEGDILVKSRGANYEAKVFHKPRTTDQPHIAVNTLIIISLTDKSYKPSYVAQIINLEETQQLLRSLSSGRTVPILSPSSLSSLQCPEASLEKQEQFETITKIIDEYQSTVAQYQKAADNLTKALKTKLMKGVI